MSRKFASFRRRWEFAKVRQRGRVVKTADLTVYRSSGGPERRPLVGITLGRTIGGAVSRNKLRRRLQSILQTALNDNAQRVLIVPRPSAAFLSFSELSEQLRFTLQ